jgi:hypothetical protein
MPHPTHTHLFLFTTSILLTMYPDCTMKAVKNRLYSFKSNGKGTPAKGTASAKSTPAKNGIKKATPSKTPGSNARGRGKATKAKAFEQDEAPVDDEEKVASPSAGRGLGQKRDLGDEDEEKMLGKKIKTEPREMEDMLRGIGAQFDEYDGNLAAESNDEV